MCVLPVVSCRRRHRTSLACWSTAVTGVVTTRSSCSCLRRPPSRRTSHRPQPSLRRPSRCYRTPSRGLRTPSLDPSGTSRRASVLCRGRRTPSQRPRGASGRSMVLCLGPRTRSLGPRGASRRARVLCRGRRTPSRVVVDCTRGVRATDGGRPVRCRLRASPTRPPSPHHRSPPSYPSPMPRPNYIDRLSNTQGC